jgi:hypothetical protein
MSWPALPPKATQIGLIWTVLYHKEKGIPSFCSCHTHTVAGWLPAQQAEEKVKAAKGSNFGENKVIRTRDVAENF